MDIKIKECLKIEKNKIFNNTNFLHMINVFLTNDASWLRWKYVKYMRIADNLSPHTHNIFKLIKYYIYKSKKNKLGNLLGYEINSRNIDFGILLYHNGPIVINGNSIIGKNISLHGDNCIGNDGISEKCPIIGDNVDIGVGAKIIGDVKIANNVTIGAGAVVVNDILEENATAVGVPARIISK